MNSLLLCRVSRFFDLWTLKRIAPDFASRARTSRAALWPKKILSASLVPIVGIIVSSSEANYGEATWLPIHLLGRLLGDEEYE